MSENNNGANGVADSAAALEELVGLNAPAPVWNVARMSFADTLETLELSVSLEEAAKANDARLMLDALKAAKEFMKRVLVSVPREWLLPDAPEALDWSKDKAYKYLESERFGELLRAFNPQTVSKNSERR